MGDFERDLECLKNAERYCHERAALAWTEEMANQWRRMAERNADWRREIESRRAGKIPDGIS